MSNEQFGFNFKASDRPTLGHVVGRGFGVYTALKMLAVGYKSTKRGLDHGQSPEEALKNGAVTAAAWISFVVFTVWYFMLFSAVLVGPIMQYNPIDRMSGMVHHQSNQTFWLIFLLAGIPALILQVAVWLTLYSRLVDKTDSNRGHLQRTGFRLHRRFFRFIPWWLLVLVAMFASLPYSILLLTL